MPLAWFSQEAEEVYHVCLNCLHISKFRHNNVESNWNRTLTSCIQPWPYVRTTITT